MSLLGLLGKLFGYAVSPAGSKVVDEAARRVLDQLQGDGTRPMPLPSSAVAHRDAQIASATRHGPPTCPPSSPPTAPPTAPPVSMNIERTRRANGLGYESPPPTPRPMPIDRPYGRSSSGPPPRMSPPPPLPPPPRNPPVVPQPPRPARRR